jgi:hypothetical protein
MFRKKEREMDWQNKLVHGVSFKHRRERHQEKNIHFKNAKPSLYQLSAFEA